MAALYALPGQLNATRVEQARSEAAGWQVKALNVRRMSEQKANLMHAMTLTALLLSLAGAAHAQTATFRDDHGHINGRAENHGNTTIYRDDRGHITGRAEQRGNTTNFRDDR